MKIKKRFVSSTTVFIAFNINLVLVFICIFRKGDEKCCIIKMSARKKCFSWRRILLIFRGGIWELNFSGA